MEDTTLDDLQYNNLHLRQNRKGYRSSEDSLLLLYTLSKKLGCNFSGNAFEFGTGSGIISILLAAKIPEITITAIEIQDSLFNLAKENVMHSGMDKKIILIRMDGREVQNEIKKETFHCAYSNPPFFQKGYGKISPNQEKQYAKHEELCTMNDVLMVFSHILKKGGRGFIIYPTHRLSECVEKIDNIPNLFLHEINFFYNLKKQTGSWKASQNERNYKTLEKESKLFVAEMRKK